MAVSYCNAADVEAELRADNAFSGSTTPTLTEVQGWIEEASDEVAYVAAQEYDSQSVTELYDYDKTGGLLLQNTPVNSLTSVEYDDSNLDESANFTTLTEDDEFVFYSDTGVIDFDEDEIFKSGRKRFRVSYDYGENSIPGRIKKLTRKMVAKNVLQTLLNKHIEDDNTGGETSVGSITIKKPSDYSTRNIQKLNEEIDLLRSELKNEFGVIRSKEHNRPRGIRGLL